MLNILPYVPRTITVHLGLPDQWAENVTVSFPDYVKNVASSEIYPTWEPSAIRARQGRRKPLRVAFRITKVSPRDTFLSMTRVT